MIRVRSLLLSAVVILAAFAPGAAIRGQAGPAGADGALPAARPSPPFSSVEAKRFLGVLGLGAVAYTLDETVRAHFTDASNPPGDFRRALAEAGNAFGSPGVLTLGVVMWGGGLAARRPTLAVSGLRAIEAITVSGLVTSALKEIAGRARPDVALQGRADWQLLRGARTRGGDNQSFASGHTTAAFAFATAVTGEVALRAPRHARTVGVMTFGMAGVTAYARMHDDRHWLSDVTVGAGIGTVTALAIRRWHATRPDNVIDRWLLRPVVGPAPMGGLRLGLEWSAR